MRRHRLGGIFLVVAAIGMVVGPIPTARATITGKAYFHCTASLPQFPSQSGSFGSCGADGLDPSVATATAQGLDDGNDGSVDPYWVGGTGQFRATFNYSDSCTAGGLPPLLGTASGHARISGLTVVEQISSPTPHVATGVADADADFQWTRVGAWAVFVTTNTRLTFALDTATAAQSGVGNASFVPILGIGNTCPTGGPLKAKVDGEIMHLL